VTERGEKKERGKVFYQFLEEGREKEGMVSEKEKRYLRSPCGGKRGREGGKLVDLFQ